MTSSLTCPGKILQFYDTCVTFIQKVTPKIMRSIGFTFMLGFTERVAFPKKNFHFFATNNIGWLVRKPHLKPPVVLEYGLLRAVIQQTAGRPVMLILGQRKLRAYVNLL